MIYSFVNRVDEPEPLATYASWIREGIKSRQQEAETMATEFTNVVINNVSSYSRVRGSHFRLPLAAP